MRCLSFDREYISKPTTKSRVSRSGTADGRREACQAYAGRVSCTKYRYVLRTVVGYEFIHRGGCGRHRAVSHLSHGVGAVEVPEGPTTRPKDPTATVGWSGLPSADDVGLRLTRSRGVAVENDCLRKYMGKFWRRSSSSTNYKGTLQATRALFCFVLRS